LRQAPAPASGPEPIAREVVVCPRSGGQRVGSRDAQRRAGCRHQGQPSEHHERPVWACEWAARGGRAGRSACRGLPPVLRQLLGDPTPRRAARRRSARNSRRARRARRRIGVPVLRGVSTGIEKCAGITQACVDAYGVRGEQAQVFIRIRSRALREAGLLAVDPQACAAAPQARERPVTETAPRRARNVSTRSRGASQSGPSSRWRS
jgi:hypothetical protein